MPLAKVSVPAGAFAVRFQNLWTFRRFASVTFCDTKQAHDTDNSIDAVEIILHCFYTMKKRLFPTVSTVALRGRIIIVGRRETHITL